MGRGGAPQSSAALPRSKSEQGVKQRGAYPALFV
jgi:hypothetical protein